MPPPPISCSGRSSDRCFSLLSAFSVRAVALAFHSADLPLFLAAFFKLSQSLRFFLLNQPVSPPRYSLHRQRPQPDALQLLHRMLLLDQHAPHLFFLRIPHPHFVPEIRRPPARRGGPAVAGASARCVRLPHRLHPYANLFSQPLQVRQRQHSFHFDVIDLLQVRPIFQHLRRQVAVIRHEHQPGCRILEIPHRKHALSESAQKVSQRLAPLRVRHRRHHFRRLVQQNVYAPPFLRFDDSPRRLNPVFRRVRLRPQLPHHPPVHLHLSTEDQQLRMPPRSNPRPRNNLLQSFFHFSFLSFLFFGRGTIHRALLSGGVYLFLAGYSLCSARPLESTSIPLRLFLISLFHYLFTSSLHSPAVAALGASPLSASGIPSLLAAVSSSNSSRSSIFALTASAP